MLALFVAIAAQTSVPAQGAKATYSELGQVDVRAEAEHCWKRVKNGRVGVAFGLVDALVVQTNRAEFEQAGIQPSIGMRIFARHNASDAYPALIVGINSEVITVTTDLQLIGSMFVEPNMPLALYSTDSRMPAVTPRVWTNELSRTDLLAIMNCYDKVQALSV